MDLVGIREQLVKVSGRYDLVDASNGYADTGMNFYINEAQKSLERKLGITVVEGKIYKDLAIGDYLIKFQDCRAIKEVWLLIAGSKRQRLEKIDESDMREVNYTVPLSSATKGPPTYYYPTNLRRIPETETGLSDSATILEFIDVDSPYDPTYKGIVIYPPSDLAYGLEIDGLFYGLKLTNDTDKNIWTVEYPSLLMKATLRELATFFKGGKTVSAWDTIIDSELVDIDKDTIEQGLSDVNKTEG